MVAVLDEGKNTGVSAAEGLHHLEGEGVGDSVILSAMEKMGGVRGGDSGVLAFEEQIGLGIFEKIG